MDKSDLTCRVERIRSGSANAGNVVEGVVPLRYRPYALRYPIDLLAENTHTHHVGLVWFMLSVTRNAHELGIADGGVGRGVLNAISANPASTRVAENQRSAVETDHATLDVVVSENTIRIIMIRTLSCSPASPLSVEGTWGGLGPSCKERDIEMSSASLSAFLLRLRTMGAVPPVAVFFVVFLLDFVRAAGISVGVIDVGEKRVVCHVVK